MEPAHRNRFVLPGVAVLLALCAIPAAGDDPKPTAKKIPYGAKDKNGNHNIFVEIQGKEKRVIVAAEVVLQKGPLEQLLTRKHTKEHEAILAADIDSRDLHAALLFAGALPGSPVRFDPVFRPAQGQKIKITLQYLKKGQLVSVPAQQWVTDTQTKKPLNVDWVYTGSKLVNNPFNPNQPIFLANEGDIVCVSNFESALLDLPIKSSKATAQLAFEANSELIPPMGTKVTMVFEPVPPKK
jgi:hypothetical protein